MRPRIAIKKIWEWLKTMAKLLRRFRREVEPEPTPHVITPLEEKLAREIQKKQARGVARAVNTSQGGPNMPKRQPCPQGHGWKKRTRKTMGGAYYRCETDGEFFCESTRILKEVYYGRANKNGT